MTTTDSTASSSGNYDSVAIALHWIIALFIIALVTSAQIAGGMEGPQRGAILGWHKAGGVIVLCLVLLRSLWRITHPAPEPIKTSPVLDTIANVVHRVFYLLLLAMPISGILMSFYFGRGIDLLGIPPLLEKNVELAKTFGAAHGMIMNAILALVLVHVSAALWHHYGRRDGTLARMVPWLRRSAN